MTFSKKEYFIIGLYLFVLFYCFILFLFRYDMSQTVASSYGILEGHIFDFYDYNINVLHLETVYGIFIYVLFALWNIPMYLLGERLYDGNVSLSILYWNKLFLLLTTVYCAYLMYRIALLINNSKDKAVDAVIGFLCMPLLFFLVIIQGTYDILYIAFSLLGIYYYFKNNNLMFNVMFGLSICVKPFCLLYYVILLLYREKRIHFILINFLTVSIPYICFNYMYKNSVAYSVVKEFNHRNLGSFFANSFPWLCLFFLLIFFLYVYTYYDDSYEKNINNTTKLFSLCNFASFIFIGLSSYHPQWIIGAIPFYVFSSLNNKRFQAYWLLMLILTIMYYILFSLQPEVHVDESMFFLPWSFGFIVSASVPYEHINSFYFIKDVRIAYSIVSASLLSLAVFSVEKYSILENITSLANKRTFVFICFLLGVLAFVVPATLCWIN